MSDIDFNFYTSFNGRYNFTLSIWLECYQKGALKGPTTNQETQCLTIGKYGWFILVGTNLIRRCRKQVRGLTAAAGPASA